MINGADNDTDDDSDMAGWLVAVVVRLRRVDCCSHPQES